MSQNLAQAHKKLLEPVFNAATNRTPKPFAIEDLPKAIDDPIWNKIEEVYQLDLQELSALKNSVYVLQYFRYSCHIVRGRRTRKFRANLYRLAEVYSGYTRENSPSDGIVKMGKDIAVALIFAVQSDLNRFQSEILEFISVVSGHKRPLIDANDSDHPHDIILQNEQTERISIPDTVKLNRVFRYHYQHDPTKNDPDNSAECDGYSDVVSLFSNFGEYVNISDPEVQVQMIEDPRSAYWINISPESAHIKDKSKCRKREKTDPNNFIYMSRFLHCYFDGLNAKPPKFPAMKIQYVSHDETMVACPAIGTDPTPLGLPKRQRVIVRIIFWNIDIRGFAMPFIRGGGKEIDQNTYEIDIYFKDAKKAETYLKWKEAQTDRAWAARNQGVSPAQFLDAEGLVQVDQESDGDDDER